MLIKEQRYFNINDGKNLYSYIYKDNEIDAKKAIVICHGMAEHIDRYDDFCKRLVNEGFIVFAYNQRGHRFTDDFENYGYMGETDNFQALVNDVKEIVEYLNTKYKLPVYLFGHSMGSFVLTRFCELHGDMIKGVVLCGTGRNPNMVLFMGKSIASIIRLFKGRKYRSKLLNSMSFGAFNKSFKPNRTDFDWLNTIDDEVDKYIADEWCGGIFTVSYFHDFFKGCIKITNNIKLIPNDLPILLISGQDDPVGNFGKAVKKVFENLKKSNHTNVSIDLVPGRHEILLEKTKEEVFNKITNFLKDN